jgi:hypothetical protein
MEQSDGDAKAAHENHKDPIEKEDAHSSPTNDFGSLLHVSDIATTAFRCLLVAAVVPD